MVTEPTIVVSGRESRLYMGTEESKEPTGEVRQVSHGKDVKVREMRTAETILNIIQDRGKRKLPLDDVSPNSITQPCTCAHTPSCIEQYLRHLRETARRLCRVNAALSRPPCGESVPIKPAPDFSRKHFYHLFHVFVAATVGFQVQNTVVIKSARCRPSAWRRFILTMNNERFAALVTPVGVTCMKSSSPQYCLASRKLNSIATIYKQFVARQYWLWSCASARLFSNQLRENRGYH